MSEASGDAILSVFQGFVLNEEGAVVVGLGEKGAEIDSVRWVTDGSGEPAFAGADPVF